MSHVPSIANELMDASRSLRRCAPVAGVIVSCSREDEQINLELEAISAELASAKAELSFLDGEMSSMSLTDL